MSIKSLFAIALFAITNSIYSQSAEKIIARHTEVVGPMLHAKDLSSLYLELVIEIKGLELPASMYLKLPRNMRLEISYLDKKMIQVVNDTAIWGYNGLTGETTLKRNNSSVGDAEAQQSEDAAGAFKDFIDEDLIYHKERGHKVRLVKTARTDTTTYYVIELVTEKNRTKQFFLNESTYLVERVIGAGKDLVFRDYRKVGVIVFPFRIMLPAYKSSIGGMRITKLQVDVQLPDSLFHIPQLKNEEFTMSPAALEKIKRGKGFMKVSQYDSAISYFTASLKIQQTATGYNARGLVQIYREEYYDAITDFNRALEIQPNDAMAMSNRGRAKYHLKDYKGAIKDLSLAISYQPSADTYEHRAQSYFELQDYEAAIRDFQEKIKLAPLNAENYYSLGATLAQAERFDEAVSQYKKASILGCKNADFHNHWGISYFNLEKYDSAEMQFKEATRRRPDDLTFIENHGRALYELARYTDAEAVFRRYLKLSAPSAEVANIVGLCRYHQEDYRGAIQFFTKAIEADDKQAIYFDNRASARENLDDYQGAIEDYTESIRIYPNDPATFYRRGMVKIYSSKKIEGCLDLTTAYDMKYEEAKEAIMKNCN